MSPRVLLSFLITVLVASPLVAHEGVHEQIERINAQLVSRPRDASLLLQRGQLHRLHGDWRSASRDFELARRLRPGFVEIDLATGLLLLDEDRPSDACAPLQRYVRAKGSDVRGRLALARALMRSGRAAAAVTEYDAIAALLSTPDPEPAIEHARALVAAHRPDDAIALLDAVQQSIGPLVALQLEAVDIECSLGRLEDALRRVAAGEARTARKETWLARRGDILLQAGRLADARAAWRAALDAIANLPEHRRRTRAIAALETRLRLALR